MNDRTKIYKDSLRSAFNRVIFSNVVARHGYDTASSYGLSEEWKLRAAIVALAAAHENLMRNEREGQ